MLKQALMALGCGGAVVSGPAAFAAMPASVSTVAAQKEAANHLPAEDGRDADFSGRGFIATLADPVIKTKDGKPVWDVDAYAWMNGASPDTVNPSLWRHMGLLRKHGLFALSEGMWQVRGLDVSNMTVIKGQTGWILIDPLTTRDTAAAALRLVNETLGPRPVRAVIYSHSHADHFGGVRGVVDENDVKAGMVQIIAPAHFMDETASENVMAGLAMGRRANYQFGGSLTPGPQGQMGSGIGKGVAGGDITLIAPTIDISKTGETRVVDGITLEFQMVPDTEAPAEMNIYVPAARTFLAAEIATCSLHNILTPRGAKVRDAHAWAGYLNEAVNLFGDRSDTIASSHCWPRFGREEVKGWLSGQRDNYRYLHDQTVRLMNKGMTQVEIAEKLRPPPAIANQWFNKGYYGTYSHNSKAIYQYYLGWYDAVPANLNPHPPEIRATKLVAAIGGASKVLAKAKKAMAAGDYRWSSDLLNSLVFADPKNSKGRALLADSYEQQGYQAESAIWRNMFLSAARDLREGVKASITTQSIDLISAVPTELLLDSVATRLDPLALGDRSLELNFNFTDRNEQAKISVGNAVMFSEMGKAHTAPGATVSGPRQLFLALMFLKIPLTQLEAAGLRVEGDRSQVEILQAALDPMPGPFNIAEP
ncbi:MBL fold metallo-hydrolase [Sphingorhabdus sp. IMCC26285]|uniref:MBL fold metallo-hydrolase n=1 Tax=Sphingorhabdus profundilacus TaxID=2509718 RepID=A0A6I4LS18_9SPHN|nr:alkyl sulfatase dimerization domain-containing protein [Sphingorhabdus profundilacus]MVZ96197.1 MBL fold metallo-hydrolase [Sphingorhabdus profundilacus]